MITGLWTSCPSADTPPHTHQTLPALVNFVRSPDLNGVNEREEDLGRVATRDTWNTSRSPECVYQLVLESQLPHKIVNLLFTITYQNNKLTILWGT